ncbi:MAG: Tad domain-containing protein [Gammaproteobacteria bacterium]|nr:Tad domain-containing protein [Gammaproteobacteria bacterium]NNC57669.1 Tad domain-containing protein [Woeseiaceae bacterium]NNL49612.1 Tad domain-containing protein [Woeseiaceae bacterium]
MTGPSNRNPGHIDGTKLSQRGVVIPIVAIGLVALFAVAGLALDGSHALANKTRMQNTVDAAALAAAKVIDQTDGDTGQATAAANNLFSINADGAGNHELNAAYDGGDINITVQYSTTAYPFTPGSLNGPFVRVIAAGFDTQTTLARVLGVNEIPTPASAVAGPSGPLGNGPGSEICDVAPIAVCPPAGGFQPDELEVLKPTAGNHDDIGPGNYKMLRLGCSGGSCLRKNLAGDFSGCATHSATVETEPGVSAGPTSQGFNTRFNKYQGGGVNPTDYPPDKVITDQKPSKLQACWDDITDPQNPVDRIFETNGQNNYCPRTQQGESFSDEPWASDERFKGSDVNYDLYDHIDYDNDPGPYVANGVKYRRLLIFPTVNCDGSQNGQSALTVTGFACFFMMQPLDTGNIGQGGGQIFGQHIGKCEVNGSGSSNPTGGSNPLFYKIVLYKDSGSGDS